MPVTSCQLGGRPGFRWGTGGKCYTYEAGDAAARDKARGMAAAQGRAIEANTEKGAKRLTRAYLEEMMGTLKTRLPWLSKLLHRDALGRSGARGRYQTDEPHAAERKAITAMTDGDLAALSDVQLADLHRRAKRWGRWAAGAKDAAVTAFRDRVAAARDARVLKGDLLPLAVVEELCPACAEEMREKGLSHLPLVTLTDEGRALLAMKASDPGFFTHCVEDIAPKAGADDPEAFCAWLHEQLIGTWPGERAAKYSPDQDRDEGGRFAAGGGGDGGGGDGNDGGAGGRIDMNVGAALGRLDIAGETIGDVEARAIETIRAIDTKTDTDGTEELGEVAGRDIANILDESGDVTDQSSEDTLAVGVVIARQLREAASERAHEMGHRNNETFGAQMERGFLRAFNREFGLSKKAGMTASQIFKFAVAVPNAEKRVVYGVVMEPDAVDTQGDRTSAEEIELAAWRFLADYRAGKARLRLQHQTDLTDAEAILVENYVAPADFTMGEQAVAKGSWVQAWHVPQPEVWGAIKKGAITGFSIGARVGVRNPRRRKA